MALKFNVGDTLVESSTGHRAQVIYTHDSNGTECYRLLMHGHRHSFSADYVEKYFVTAYQHEMDEINKAMKPIEIEIIIDNVTPMPHNIVTLQDAMLFEIETKKPKYTGQAFLWHKEGRCTQCGELGRYHLSTAICSKHGAY